MTDPQFVCAACDESYEGDTSTVMTECKVCNRLHCSDCVDEFGRCVECKETSPGYFMNCCRETTRMGVPPGNRPACRGIGAEAT